jgi:hypothetical protein
MKSFTEVETTDGKARLYKGFTQYEAPKSYTYLKALSHNIGNDYNSSILRLHKAKDGSLRYEIYRDGNFYPYFGRFEFIKQ